MFCRLIRGLVSTLWKYHVRILTVCIVLTLTILLHKYPFRKTSSVSQASAIDVYRHVEKLSVNGIVDPPCNWSLGRNMYLCSGHCPWISKQSTKCTFLKRIIDTNFQENGMYCTPPADGCISYNAWFKEKLPLTLNPVHKIPKDILHNFTLNGLIPVLYNIGFHFANYSGSGLNWSVSYVNTYTEKVKGRKPYGTYQTTALYPVLDAYSEFAIRKKKCAVIGSEYPWIEAALLEFGATNVTTIEYNRILTDVPNLLTIMPDEFAAAQEKNANDGNIQPFDSVWSYSSLEHDGLGRYTDPINPYGDFQTMVKISCMLKPAGLLFLAVPTNKNDAIHFNLHRVYGPIRYPVLYRHFHVVQVFGDGFDSVPSITWRQPILVLQNKVGCH